MNKYFILLLVFLAAGCGESTFWTKFDGSPDEFDRTQIACHDRTYSLPEAKQDDSPPDYRMEIQFTGNNENPITAAYKVAFLNLSNAFGSLAAAFEDVAGKELLFESCMDANGWAKTSVSAVALTEPAFAMVGAEMIVYEGIAVDYLDRTGTIKIKNDAGNVCAGSFRYLTNWTGDGSIRCGDGDSAKIEFQGLSGTSGYGGGTTRKGKQFNFVYGVEEEEIHRYLKAPNQRN